MSKFCSYHPLSPAKWECRSCKTFYDRSCVPEANEKERSGNCPRCGGPLHYISAADIQPYWKINAQFFRNAFKAPLLYIITLLCLAQLVIPLHEPALYVFNGALITLALSYGWYILRSAFRGILDLPTSKEFSADMDVALVLAPAIVVLSYGTPILLAFQFFGAAAATAVAVMISLIVPAALIVLGHDRDLRSAFQPQKLIPVTIFLGPSYLGLSVYILLGMTVSLFSFDFASQHISENFALPAGTFIGSYFAIALIQMHGYAGHQYKHNLLHKATATAKLRDNPKAYTDKAQRIDADVLINAVDGNYKNLVEILETHLKQRSSAVTQREQLFKVLMALKDRKKLDKHSHSFIRLLLNKGREKEAAEFIKFLRQGEDEFKLHDAHLSYEMAHAALRINDPKLVVWLGKDAHLRMNDHEYIPRLYYLLGETLLKHYKNPQKAKSYLSFVIKNYPDHDVLAKALPLLKSIQASLKK